MADLARPVRSLEREEVVAAVSSGVQLGLTLTVHTVLTPFIPPFNPTEAVVGQDGLMGHQTGLPQVEADLGHVPL
jgi:hypothetical protein